MARRAENLLAQEASETSQPVDLPNAEELSFEQGLALQSVPELNEVTDDTRTVRGGLPQQAQSVGASRRVWDRFQRQYPRLSKVVASDAGKSARRSAVRDVAGRRVAQGLGSTASSSRVVPSGEDGSTTEATSWRNAPISHPATSEWQSVDVAELSLPKADTDKKEEVKEEVKVEPRGEAADHTEYEFVEVSDVESEALSDRPEPGGKEEQVELAEEDSSYYNYSYSSRPTLSSSYKPERQEQVQRSEPYWSNYRWSWSWHQSGWDHSGWHHWNEDHRSGNWQGGYHR